MSKTGITTKHYMNGYMTVYLSLTLAVLLSLCLAMIEGVRSNAIILESEIAYDVAMNSILAEYNRELMKQYNIFAIEDSYGGNNASLDNTEAHLVNYLNKNFSANHFLGVFLNYRDYLGIEVDQAQIDGVLYLTDASGDVFMRRAYEAIKDDVGMTLLSEIREWATSIENSGLETMDLQGNMTLLEEQAQEAQMEASQNEEGEESSSVGEIIEVDSYDIAANPAGSLISGMSGGVIDFVIDDPNTISSKSIEAADLISHRMNSGNVNVGNLSLEDNGILDEAIERMVFQEYLMRYMGRYGNECDEDALSYQIEYVIAGHNSDRENLDDVLSRIYAIRFAAAYLYIQNDEEKKTMAELIADVLAIITFTEGMEDVYKELYLLAWAGSEAIYDVKSLLVGNRVDLFKTEDNWHTAANLTTEDNEYSGDGEGLSYPDYLRVFMTLMSKNDLVAKGMDMVEADIRCTNGNTGFRMDACIDTVQTNIRIRSTFGYEYSYTLKRKYE